MKQEVLFNFLANREPIRLHLELKEDHLSEDAQIMLKRYGESSTGTSISRDILIPFDMPLHNLHYAIQTLFGWRNSHLRRFELPEAVFAQVTEGTVKRWSELVGFLFQPPSEGEEDIFWDDDYNGGNPKAWMRRKYTGPYSYGGILEEPDAAQKDVNEILDSYSLINVREPHDLNAILSGVDGSPKVTRKAALRDLTMQELNSSYPMDNPVRSLLERLLVVEVLASPEDPVHCDGRFPVTHELTYIYDFGTDWTVSITRPGSCTDLISNHYLSESELEDAINRVKSTHRPVCLRRDGISLMDDVGCLGGFADFLCAFYEGEDKMELAELKEWAKFQGWSNKKTSIKSVF